MKTFEEYIKYACIYKLGENQYIDSETEWNLAAVLKEIGDIPPEAFWLASDYGDCDVKLYFRKSESDEEFEQRKLGMHENYMRSEGINQQREIEEYKRLKLKYEGM